MEGGGWAPNTQATVAVLVFGGFLWLTHLVSLHVNGGVNVG